jgi:hypothetical protein
MDVDEVEAALRAHGSTPHIGRLQLQYGIDSPNPGQEMPRISIQAVVAVTETNRQKLNTGDHILVLFTEGHKAYLIERSLNYDTSMPTDVILKQATERYGNPPPESVQPFPTPDNLFLAFDSAGRLIQTAPALATCNDSLPLKNPDNVHSFVVTAGTTVFGNDGRDNLLRTPESGAKLSRLLYGSVWRISFTSHR